MRILFQVYRIIKLKGFRNNLKSVYEEFFQKFPFNRRLKCSVIRNEMMKSCFHGNAQELNLIQQKSHPITVFGYKRIGNVKMSSNIVKNIQDLIENSHKPSIRSSAMKMYASLRNSIQKNENKFSSIEVDAYLCGIMPQVYASLYNVINELRMRLGDKWIPETVLDCGTGPGIGALVFQELFSDSIEKVKNIVVIESMYTMRQSAFYIHKGNRSKIVSSFPSSTKSTFDFIIANHTILERNISQHIFNAYIRKLWAKLSPKGGILLLLERGNPMGYEAIAKARQTILSSFDSNLRKDSEITNIGHVISPCPHDKQCPFFINGHVPNRKKWCHFSQRLVMPSYLQKIKHSSFNIEDAKFSYCVIQKGIDRFNLNKFEINLNKDDLFYDSYNWSRLILPPLKRHGHVIMDTCTFDGTIQRIIISKSHGKICYRNARKVHWGDLWAFRTKFF